jgi:alpha-tubulin suppressor-like RCC1 family protein
MEKYMYLEGIVMENWEIVGLSFEVSEYVGSVIDRSRPTLLCDHDVLRDKKIAQISTSSTNSMALTEDGMIVAWGRNTRG